MGFLKFSLIVTVCLASVSESRFHKHSKHVHFNHKEPITIDIVFMYDQLAIKKVLTVPPSQSYNFDDMLPYTERLIQATQALFDDEILGRQIKLNLVRTKVIKNNRYATGSTEKYLKTYCGWQMGIKKLNGTNYLSVLMTASTDLRPSELNIGGLTYTNSYCQQAKSCTILQWDFERLPLTLAHNIGHSLGITDDARKCHREDWSAWTKCSADGLEKFLKSPKGSCLV